MESPVTLKIELPEALHIMKGRRVTKYVEGEKFKVLQSGARLEGFLLHGEELISGWSRNLTQGEVLTCKGWSVVEVGKLTIRGVQWAGVKIPKSATTVQVWPFDGLFRPFPLTGLLGPYVEDSGENLDELIIEDGHEVDLTSYLGDTSHLVASDDKVVDLSGF